MRLACEWRVQRLRLSSLFRRWRQNGLSSRVPDRRIRGGDLIETDAACFASR